jgi:hypothetical protein
LQSVCNPVLGCDATPKKSLQIPRHRYRDSNPGFRTENPAS